MCVPRWKAYLFDGIGRIEDIIGVQKTDYIPGGYLDSFIDGIVYTVVRFADPAYVFMRFGIRFNHLACSVRGSPVHNNVLDIRVRLMLNTLQRPL